jgi:phosphotransferase system enzyme I (PtsP)
LTAEAAVEKVQNDLRKRYAAISDPYLRERLADLDDLTNRLLLQLVHDEGGPLFPQPAEMILVARSLGPADLLDYDRQRMRGLVLEEGAATAHVAIVAGALGIPVLGRASGALNAIENGDQVILDADHGQVFIRPSAPVQEQFNQSAVVRQAQQNRYRAARSLPAVSQDGVDVTLSLNAGLLIDLANLELTGAAGIGLYRTEVPFMVRADYPDVTAQRDIYDRIFEGVGGRPVVFRTLDAGGDKRIQSLAEDDAENPAMGWRSIRMALDRPSMLRQQLRAMLLAAAGRPFSVMFPMITSVDEFTAARGIFDLECRRAAERGLAVSDQLKLGAMIEVPAAVWGLDALLAETDFVSVGSNDLAQFFFAADRGSQRLAGRFSPLSAPFLSVLSDIEQRCRRAGVPVTVCGEMAGKPLAAAALVALGYRRLSMTASAIGPVKEAIRNLHVGPLQGFLSDALARRDRHLPTRIQQFYDDHFSLVDKSKKVN